MQKMAKHAVHARWLTRGAHGCALAALCAPLLWAVPAAAQDEADAAETAAARSLAQEGIKLADAGRCEEAVEKLARAEKLHHAPVVLGRLGECQISQGKLVEGTENLRKVLREALPPEPAAVLVRARERASAVLERVKPRIGALNIIVKGPRDNAEVEVVVDGQAMNAALLEADRPSDPGEHFVEASAPGFVSASARVSVGVGEKQSIVLTLEPAPKARSAAGAASTERASSASDTASLFTRDPPLSESPASASSDAGASAPRNLTGAYIGWAAGGAAVAAGSVFGLLAFEGKSDLDKQCAQNVCPDSSADRLHSARRDSTVATVLMAVGGVGLGLGTIFYFSAGPKESGASSGDAAESHERRKDAARAQAWIGLGQVGLSGEF
jgi:hypothetical protein